MNSIEESIKTNLLFNEPSINKKILNENNFKKKNITICDVTKTKFEKNYYYVNRIRESNRMGKNYKFSYISPTDLSNNLEVILPTVEANVSYRFIFFISSWSIENIDKFELVNGDEILFLKSQINSTYTNYITCTINTNVKNIYLNISFKQKQISNFPNGLYLLNNYCIIKTTDTIYNSVLMHKHKELIKINKTYDFVICIAIWNRHTILKKIIELVNSYKFMFNIGFVLIYSKEEDNNLFANHKNVHFFYHPNQPLGSKWLSSIYHSQLFNPNAIMILGSDDLVSKKYILEAYLNIKIKNHDFCYSKYWLTYNSSNNYLYRQKYVDSNPKILGAGRVFSSKFLKKLHYKIYDPTICRALDNTFKFLKKEHNPSSYIIQNLGILLYKGNWECISDIKTLITSRLLKTELLNNQHPNTKKIYENFNITFAQNTNQQRFYPKMLF